MKYVVYPIRLLVALLPLHLLAQPAAEVNAFDPLDSTSLVVNKKEFAANLVEFRNYQGWKRDPKILHNKLSRTTRPAGSIRFLVLHESGGPDNGAGFNPPLTAHFSVLRNGKVIQFNDMAEVQYHAYQFNNASIGIEFVNLGWVTGKGLPARESSLTPAQRSTYAESNGYLWTFWGDGYNVYRLPDEEQLESLNALVIRLLRKLDSGFPSINSEYLQQVSYDQLSEFFVFKNEKDIPKTLAAKAVRNYFIFSSAFNYMDPERFKDFESGIISHACINNIRNGYVDDNGHPDGSFQSLYCLLRKRFGSETAFDKAQELMKNNVVVARTKNMVKWTEGAGDSKIEKTGYRNVYLIYLGDL